MLATGRIRTSGWRIGAALALWLLAVGAAVGAALLTAPGSLGLADGVARASAASSTLLGRVATALPFGYAFGAGMVASVNPCGFALLPAYIGLFLGDDRTSGGERTPGGALRRALLVSGCVTLGFVVLFGLVGLAMSAAASVIVGAFPWIEALVGAGLAALGASMALGGGGLRSGLAERVAGRVGRGARDGGLRGYLLYGIAYGAASLGCTLPIFLLVMTGALTGGGVVGGALGFVSYALGMGAVVAGVTLATAFLGTAAVSRVRALSRYVRPVSAALLLVVGAYVLYYGLTTGDLV